MEREPEIPRARMRQQNRESKSLHQNRKNCHTPGDVDRLIEEDGSDSKIHLIGERREHHEEPGDMRLPTHLSTMNVQ